MEILSVEDNVHHALILRHALKAIGFTQVTEAYNGREALRFLESKPFDMVLTDWNMPKMDGITLVRRIRAWDPDDPRQLHTIPIIMISVQSREEDLLEAISAGVDAFIIKPVTREILREKLAPFIK